MSWKWSDGATTESALCLWQLAEPKALPEWQQNGRAQIYVRVIGSVRAPPDLVTTVAIDDEAVKELSGYPLGRSELAFRRRASQALPNRSSLRDPGVVERSPSLGPTPAGARCIDQGQTRAPQGKSDLDMPRVNER